MSGERFGFNNLLDPATWGKTPTVSGQPGRAEAEKAFGQNVNAAPKPATPALPTWAPQAAGVAAGGTTDMTGFESAKIFSDPGFLALKRDLTNG